MDKNRETSSDVPEAAVAEAWQRVGASFERFCLTAGCEHIEPDDGAGRGRTVRPALRP